MNANLYEFAGDESQRGLQTDGEILRNLTSFQKVWTFRRNNDEWTLNKNNGDPTGVVINRFDFSHFGKVRAFSLWVDATTVFADLEYSTPMSQRVITPFACGSLHSGWLIEIFLGENTTANNITIYG
jgi:hypothetical protein